MHQEITNFYNSVQPELTEASNITVREWLNTQSSVHSEKLDNGQLEREAMKIKFVLEPSDEAGYTI